MDKSGAAFPSTGTHAFGQETGWKEGLTKREYFAGQSMLAYRARNDEWAQSLTAERVAILAVEDADALLKELEKNG